MTGTVPMHLLLTPADASYIVKVRLESWQSG